VAANRPSLVNLALLQSPAFALAGKPTSSRGIRRGTRSRAATGMPLHRRSDRASTPMRCHHRISSSKLPLRTMFRPRGFSPPRRVPPLGGRRFVAPCCRSWGSPRFLHGPPYVLPKQSMDDPHVPRNVFRTPRRIPLIRSRTMSPWPLPPCRSPEVLAAHPFVSVARPELPRRNYQDC